MKITSFNPLIVTKDVASVSALFEDLGFERKHNPTDTSAVGNEYISYRMTDGNGFHVDVSYSVDNGLLHSHEIINKKLMEVLYGKTQVKRRMG